MTKKERLTKKKDKKLSRKSKKILRIIRSRLKTGQSLKGIFRESD